MTRHPTVALLYTPPADSEPWPWGPGSQPRLVEIDKGLAGTISELWRAGIDTASCCQGGSGAHDNAVICFGSEADTRRFMTVMLASRRHKVPRRPVAFDSYTARQWFEAIHGNLNHDGRGVVFPPADIPEVEARVRWWNTWAPAPWYQQRLPVP